MSKRVSIYMFNIHIADIYQIEDRIYLRQFNNGAHLASPISIAKI
ncbi:MAG: hypothetical protein SPLUMA2_SPLUMAMAG2_01793 [uncultured Sulfurimonas sp.]|nr:MAG: hypothetical protein SPLUMA1_SPLUMAMAG1_01915 [uncultured Sulfurimonas sp.]CAI6150636.1 MAG: hypothetical protein SPLUMA2_SPLUMAMAG2_01793 [uncultured Sulfurimonas sp.]